MYGSNYFKMLVGTHFHIGYMTTDNLTIPTGVTIAKGTYVDQLGSDEFKCQLASGGGVGFLTQDVDNDGPISDAQYKNVSIGKQDLPVKKGDAVSVRVMHPGGQVELEGLGAAEPGNLVATTGTGALSTSTAKETPLSTFCGAIREAQAGELVVYLMKDPTVTPYTDGNLRVRVEAVSPFVKAS